MNMRKQRIGVRNKVRAQRGFTLLLAALVASVVLALGASIFQIAQKQLVLSSLGRDSQFAFYAADTAVECALYWDFRFDYFAQTTPDDVDPKCDDLDMNVQFPDGGPPYSYPYILKSAKMDFFRDVSPGGRYCAQISVTKTLNPSTNSVETLIHADGYSVDCAGILTSDHALQRSVELRY